MSTTDAEWDALWTAFDIAAEMISPAANPRWEPYPYQRPPDLPWYAWMLFGGRGSGKTAAAAKYVHDHIHGPPCLPDVPGGHWISIVAPTLGDAVTSCVNGPSGLRKWEPGIKVVNEVGGAIVRWPNGANAKLFGAHKPEDIERFRAGGNRCMVWCEEMAAWRYLDDAWQQIRYGLRLGPRPHAIISTTPRSRKLIKDLIEDPKVVVTHGRTADNQFLDDEVKKMLYEDYAGTRMGRQELLGEYLEDVPGALWKLDNIDKYRISELDLPDYVDRVVVAVDPEIKSDAGSDETGIVVGASVRRWNRPGVPFQELPHAFVMADRSIRGTPRYWAETVLQAYDDFKADLIVAEINNGGEMVIHTIHSVRDSAPVKVVHATRGKARRAEPVASLYEQGRVHHVGVHGKLEDQMVTWDAEDPDPKWSPDRMDALVWLITELLVGRSMVRRNRLKDRRLDYRR